MKKWLFIAGAFLFLSTYIYYQRKENKRLEAETERLANNVETLASSLRYRVFRDSIRAAEVSSLVLEVDELKNLRKADAQTIKELRLKPKDVVTIEKVTTEVKDSVVFAVVDSCIRYTDTWTHIEACLPENTLTYSVKDSVQSILHIDYQKRFLWWRWKPCYKLTLIPNNPRSCITSAEVIVMK